MPNLIKGKTAIQRGMEETREEQCPTKRWHPKVQMHKCGLQKRAIGTIKGGATNNLCLTPLACCLKQIKQTNG
jgi:hypothetical protein